MRKLPTKSVRMWVARYEDNTLSLFRDKPKKVTECNENFWSADGPVIFLDPNLFPNVKWEDNEPTRVYLRTIT